MTLARWQNTITDDAGNIVPNAFVEVTREDTGAALPVLYTDRDGLVQTTNPVQAGPDGYVFFHVTGGAYKLRAYSGDFERIWRYVGIGRGSETDIVFANPAGSFSISNVYSVGDFVTFSGFTYISRVDNNLGNQPSVVGDTAFWMMVPATGAPGATGPTGPGIIAHSEPPRGRLTLATGTPIMTSDFRYRTSIFFTPYKGNTFTHYDGSVWAIATFSELSLALDSNAGHSLYHEASRLFDVWLDYNAGTPRIVTNAAWTNNTTRAEAIATQDGIVVNNATMTVRFGTGAGDTVSRAARTLVHLGTFRTSIANGETEFTFGGVDVPVNFFLWNRYNQELFSGCAQEPDNSLVVATGTIGAYMGNTNLRVNVVSGDVQLLVDANAMGFAAQSNVQYAMTAIGLDSTTAFWAGQNFHPATTAITVNNGIYAYASGNVGLGFHFVQMLHFGAGAGNVTFFGDNNDPTHQQSGICGKVWL